MFSPRYNARPVGKGKTSSLRKGRTSGKGNYEATTVPCYLDYGGYAADLALRMGVASRRHFDAQLRARRRGAAPRQCDVLRPYRRGWRGKHILAANGPGRRRCLHRQHYRDQRPIGGEAGRPIARQRNRAVLGRQRPVPRRPDNLDKELRTGGVRRGSVVFRQRLFLRAVCGGPAVCAARHSGRSTNSRNSPRHRWPIALGTGRRAAPGLRHIGSCPHTETYFVAR